MNTQKAKTALSKIIQEHPKFVSSDDNIVTLSGLIETVGLIASRLNDERELLATGLLENQEAKD